MLKYRTLQELGWPPVPRNPLLTQSGFGADVFNPESVWFRLLVLTLEIVAAERTV